MIAAALIVILAISVYAIRRGQRKAPSSLSSSQNSHANENQEYRNLAYGFSFSYPASWKLTDLNQNGSVLNFDATNGSRMTVYATDSSGTGISALLNKGEEKSLTISGAEAKEQIWRWNGQAPNSGQIGLISVNLQAKGGPLELDFQPHSTMDQTSFQVVLDTLRLY